MEEIFNFYKKAQTLNYGVGVDTEKALFIQMVNDKENILNEKDYYIELERIIGFISNIITFKESYFNTYNEIVRVLKLFKEYGNEETTYLDFKEIVNNNEKEQKYHNNIIEKIEDFKNGFAKITDIIDSIGVDLLDTDIEDLEYYIKRK